MAKTVGVHGYFEGRDLFQGLDRAGQAVDNFGKGLSRTREGAQKLGTVIATLGDTSGQTGRLLGSMLSGLAYGGPAGLAIAAVGELVNLIKDTGKEAEVAAAKWKKSMDEVVDIEKKVTAELKRQELLKRGMPQEYIDAIIGGDSQKLDEYEVAAGTRAEEARAKLRKAVDRVPTMRGKPSEEVLPMIEKHYQYLLPLVDELKRAESELNAIIETREKLYGAARGAVEIREGKEAAERSRAAAKRQEEEERRLQAEVDTINRTSEAMAKELGIEDRLTEAKKKQFDAQWRLFLVSEEIEFLLENGKQVPDVLMEKWEALKKSVDLYYKLVERRERDAAIESIKRTAPNESGFSGFEEEGARMPQYDALKALDEKNLRALSEKIERNLQPVANAFQNFFDGVLFQGQSVVEGLGNMFKSLASQLIGFLIQLGLKRVAAAVAAHMMERPVKTAEVTAAAGVAGAEAATNPLVAMGGPGAVAAYSLATSNAVIAAMMPLAMAARGWDLPAGGPFPAVLHSREMVLPEKYADIIRDGRLGGQTVNNNFILNERGFQREVRRAARANGRNRRA